MKKSLFYTLKKRKEFLAVSKAGQRFYGEHFLVQTLQNKELSGIFRVGYVVTRKTGNAVKRNKAKRRLRSLVYQEQDKFVLQYDYVFVARNSLWSVEFDVLQRDFINVLKKISRPPPIFSEANIDRDGSCLSDTD
ncbi:MAG: ribonuclease P protein component [Candidatus Paracaedibacteraceae bacterium]|nr:ribonuclease P protein component [Candidatus Paracaedibacteraceae bacterium]